MTKRRQATKAATKPRAGKSGGKDELDRFGGQALRRLAWLMENAASEQAQVAAAKELLERAHGRVGVLPDAEPDGGMEDVVARLRALRGGNP